jgi:cell division protein ZapA
MFWGVVVMDKTRTVVKICGKEYTMAGFESEEYIHRVAIYVDRKMSELKNQYVNLNPSTLAVLTALNVADDLLKLQDQMEALTREYQVLSEELKRVRSSYSADRDSLRGNVSNLSKERHQIFDSLK